jgi:hypothetical protein
METDEEIEELYKENDRLLSQLLLANKCIEILEIKQLDQKSTKNM